MNERVKKLTGQALDELVPNTWTTLGYDKIKEIQFRTVELVVEELMDQINKTMEFTWPEMQVKIRAHFGVE